MFFVLTKFVKANCCCTISDSSRAFQFGRTLFKVYIWLFSSNLPLPPWPISQGLLGPLSPCGHVSNTVGTSLGHSGTVFSHIFSLPGPSSLMQHPCTPHSLGAIIPLTFKAGFKSPPHKAWSAFQSPVYPGPVLHANCLASVS